MSALPPLARPPSSPGDPLSAPTPVGATTPPRPAVLIVGCGYVGTALAEALACDHEVFGLRRSATALPTGVTAIRADVSRPFDLPALPPLAAVFYLVGADARTPDAYRQAYEEGPRELLAALARAGQQPGRLIQVSSTSVYGQADGETLDENSATEPANFAGQAVLAGETRFAASGLAVTRVRFSGIYGPGRDSMVRGVADGSLGLTEANPVTNRIHRDDCVAILAFLLEADAPPAIVLGSDPQPTRRNDVIRWLAGQLGREPAPQAAGPSTRRVAGDRWCQPRWLLAQGYRFRHPDFRSGYGDLLAQRVMATEPPWLAG